MPKNKKIRGPLLRAEVDSASVDSAIDPKMQQCWEGPLFGVHGGFGGLRALRYPQNMTGVSHERFPWVTRKDLGSNVAILADMSKFWREHKDAIMAWWESDAADIVKLCYVDPKPWAWHAFEAGDIDLSKFTEW